MYEAIEVKGERVREHVIHVSSEWKNERENGIDYVCRRELSMNVKMLRK